MAALLYASRLPGAAYEIVLVAANDPEAEALALAVSQEPPAVSRAGDFLVVVSHALHPGLP